MNLGQPPIQDTALLFWT